MQLAAGFGLLAYLYIFNREHMRQGISKLRPKLGWPIIFMIVSTADWALFTWSAQYVGALVSVILFELWPFYFIFMLARIRATQDVNAKNSKYEGISLGLLTLMIFAFFGLFFITLSQVYDAPSLFSRSISATFFGISIGLLAGLLAALSAASNIAIGVHSNKGAKISQPQSGLSYQMAHTVVALIIARVCGGVLLLCIGMLPQNGLTFNNTAGALMTGIFLLTPAMVLLRIANLIKGSQLEINIMSYITPGLAILWLLFANIELPRIDMLIIGASVILSVNILAQYQSDEQVIEQRLGFRALILALWLFGTIVYLRDELPIANQLTWTTGDYWAMLGVSMTIFILILAFRVTRLVDRTTREEHLAASLFGNFRSLIISKSLDGSSIELLAKIDSLRDSQTLERVYHSICDKLEAALLVTSSNLDVMAEQRDRLARAQIELDEFVRSKQRAREFSELVTLIIVGGIVVTAALFSRPYDPSPSWSMFLSEVFAFVLASAIVFLMVDLADRRRLRDAPFFKRHISQALTFHYRAVFWEEHHEKMQRFLAIGLSIGIFIAMVSLLYNKWLNLGL